MSSYISVVDDTFEIISRKEFGTEILASVIRSANPGIFEPISVGTFLVIPLANLKTFELAFENVDTENEIQILIRGKRFRFWNKVTLDEKIDSIATVELDAPFDPDIEIFKESFRPFKYDDMEIKLNGDTIFVGTMVSVVPRLEANSRMVNVQGYALPGVLNDCMAPSSLAPLEFLDQNLTSIAKTVCDPFGIRVRIEGSSGAVFEKVALKPTQKIFSFLSDLASQRNFVITSTPSGDLLFHRDSEKTGTPRALLSQGSEPLMSVQANFKSQDYFASVTGIQTPPIFDFLGTLEPFTQRNKRLEGVTRPFVFIVKDADNIAELKEGVGVRIGRMFANAASYSITVSTWRDSKNRLWRPNTTIKLIAPGAMIYTSYEFIIRRIKFIRDNNRFTADLNLITPGSLSGKVPEDLPWDL